MKAISNAVSGIAMGIGNMGIAGGLIVGSLLFQKDLRELKDNVVEMWPEGGTFLSPEWISKWGVDPLEQIEEDTTTPHNHTVDELPISGIEGKSVYQTYSIAMSGWWAAYDHAKNNIITDFHAHVAPSDHVAPNSPEEAALIANWHQLNDPPPRMLLLNEFDHQMGIRYTARVQLL